MVTPTSPAAPPSFSPNSPQHVGIFSATPPIVCFSTTALTSPCISNMAPIFYPTPVLPPLSVTETKVRLELGRLCSGKVASPDIVSKTCLFTPLHSCFLCIRQGCNKSLKPGNCHFNQLYGTGLSNSLTC